MNQTGFLLIFLLYGKMKNLSIFIYNIMFCCFPSIQVLILSKTISARASIDSAEANATCGVTIVFLLCSNG